MSASRCEVAWDSPWFDPLAEIGSALAPIFSREASFVAVLNALGRAPVRFVPQSDLPEGVAYEQHIFDTGQVPTRDNLHDFFNGLCWHRFPAAKRRLNQLQAAQIAQVGVGQVRGAVRDALTLFDENAALLQAPDALWDALTQRDWPKLFIELRPLWSQARLVLVGHALLEKLVTPYKSITAHVYAVPVPLALSHELAQWDTWLASRLEASELAGKPFTPLPVLGVPGWWAPNEDPAFYDDSSVFRPPRPAATP
ncbi:DUF3025 domain-containing protein [Hydrogenophaga sp.]|uniref:DUF3025 domain-containing protein n=1 Tax=Hydrogenophaga sp. TaxID=1904254 RepID=UPI0025BFE363|nr:DUF3025 domain-containing protein [Hydrogenophaga sp.]